MPLSGFNPSASGRNRIFGRKQAPAPPCHDKTVGIRSSEGYNRLANLRLGPDRVAFARERSRTGVPLVSESTTFWVQQLKAGTGFNFFSNLSDVIESEIETIPGDEEID